MEKNVQKTDTSDDNESQPSSDEDKKPSATMVGKTKGPKSSDSEDDKKTSSSSPGKRKADANVSEEVLKRRADNRRHAAASRKRVKDLTDRLAKDVQELQQDIELELQESAVLRRRMETLTAENERLRTSSVMQRHAYVNVYSQQEHQREQQASGGFGYGGLAQGSSLGFPLGLSGSLSPGLHGAPTLNTLDLAAATGLSGAASAGLPSRLGPGGMGAAGLSPTIGGYSQYAAAAEGSSMFQRLGNPPPQQLDMLEEQLAARDPIQHGEHHIKGGPGKDGDSSKKKKKG